MIGFGFYGISTIVGYIMPNSVNTYILNIYNFQTHFVGYISKRALAHFLHIVKTFQVFLSNTNTSFFY